MVICSKKRKTDSGYGLPWMSAQEKLPVYISENAIKKVLKAYGIHCLLFTVNVRFHNTGYRFPVFICKNFPVRVSSPSAKSSGKTDYIECLNLAMRQRVSRLVRKTLSFSKNMENHAGAVRDFVNHYNEALGSFLFG